MLPFFETFRSWAIDLTSASFLFRSVVFSYFGVLTFTVFNDPSASPNAVAAATDGADPLDMPSAKATPPPSGGHVLSWLVEPSHSLELQSFLTCLPKQI